MMQNMRAGFGSSQRSFNVLSTSENVENSATSVMNFGKRLVNTPIPSYVLAVKAPWINNGKSLIQGHRVVCARPVRLPDEQRTKSSSDGRKAILTSASLRSPPALKEYSEANTDLERAALEYVYGEKGHMKSKSLSNGLEFDGARQHLILDREHAVTASAASHDMERSSVQVGTNRRTSIGQRETNGDITSSRSSTRRLKLKRVAGEPQGSVLVSSQTRLPMLQDYLTTNNLQQRQVSKPRYQKTGRKRFNISDKITSQDKKKKSISTAERDTSEINDRQQWAEDEQLMGNEERPSVLMDWAKLEHKILTAEEETKLAELARPYKQLQTLRQELSKKLKREPSDEEWANVANLSLNTLLEQLQRGSAARNKFVHHNLRLVLFHARKYEKGKLALSLYDLCQAGVKGLVDAVDHFDLQKGCRFSTYALFWVRTAIVRAVSKFGNSSQEPYNFAMHKLEIKNASMDLLCDLQRPPTDEEIMERLGYRAKRYKTILRSETRTTSLHVSPNSFDGERISNLADPNTGRHEMKYVGEIIGQVLDCLTPQEKIVLTERYGLGGSREKSLREVGSKLNLSQEMVRRYETRGLVQLRNSTRKKYLRRCLEDARLA
ncbi:hypothetical protein O6H91_14G002600 [Diphasiastrum complanatum]|uniref:Uncharacterized protein n=1 Tax=Diphasiastrum complanatum TaxID=34168 RepID=A0ACC2BLU7_DIPCM|nr:hypothetical protein O6H91_14G002600 [Diphasiastrum complanatum]